MLEGNQWAKDRRKTNAKHFAEAEKSLTDESSNNESGAAFALRTNNEIEGCTFNYNNCFKEIREKKPTAEEISSTYNKKSSEFVKQNKQNKEIFTNKL